ncbi:hypothetical protein GCM10025779_16390 [Arthrobacter cryoconiti]
MNCGGQHTALVRVRRKNVKRAGPSGDAEHELFAWWPWAPNREGGQALSIHQPVTPQNPTKIRPESDQKTGENGHKL